MLDLAGEEFRKRVLGRFRPELRQSTGLMDSALLEAAEKGDVSSLKQLVAVNPAIIYSATAFIENTALHIAASKGHTRFIHEVLANAGAVPRRQLLVQWHWTSKFQQPELRAPYTELLIFRKNIDGDTPLHLAAKAGHLEVAVDLLGIIRGLVQEKKLQTDFMAEVMMNEKGNTPLHEAVAHRKSEVALKLLEDNPGCAHQLNKENKSPFHIAARNDLVSVVKKIADMGLPTSSSTNFTALHEAVLGDSIGSLEILLNKNVESTDSLGNNALHYAARYNRALMVSMLHNRNSSLAYKKNGEHYTPLHVAAKYGSTDAAKEMLKQCPDAIDIVDIHGRNAFHVAVINDKANVLELLPECDLKEKILNEQDRDDNTPLHHAAKHRRLVELTDSSGSNALHYTAWYNRALMVSMLHNKNSSLAYKKNDEHYTPLHVAAKYGSAEAAKELLKECPDAIEIVDIHGRNAFHVAVINDKANVLELLLECDLKEKILNEQDRDGNTPLHHAAKRRQSRELRQSQAIVLLLNDQRINPLVINKDGHTAWDYEIPEELLAQIPRVLMDSQLTNAINSGDISTLVDLLAGINHDKIYSVTPEERNTTLHLAASNENEWIVHQLLLRMNRDVGIIVTKNVNGDTPLHLAAREGHLEVVKHLMGYIMWAKEIEPNLKEPLVMQTNKGDTPLHEAVLQRKSDIAINLLDANPSCAHMLNAAEQSPFYIAVKNSLSHVVKKIADQGLAVDSTHHGTALHQAVAEDNIWVLDILLDKYEELLNSVDSSRNNALHDAARCNNARMVSKLLKKKFTLVYELNDERHTPLHVAAKHGSMDAARELLKQCPDVIEKVDTEGRNALHTAVINYKAEMLELLLKYVVTEGILNQPDRNGNTPLHHAARLCQLQPTLLLLNDPRVNPCLFNQDGDTAFALFRKAVIFELNADELNAADKKHLWKELKKHESRRCKRQLSSTKELKKHESRRRKRQSSITERYRLRWYKSPYFELRRMIIVATLMSMSTFAAMLTMPGSYKWQSGIATAGRNRAFKIFVVCDTISMCGSIALVLCFLLGWQDPAKVKLGMLIWANRLFVLSGFAMIMSMLAAVYLRIALASPWVAYTVVAIGASTPFLGCLIMRKAMLLPMSWRASLPLSSPLSCSSLRRLFRRSSPAPLAGGAREDV